MATTLQQPGDGSDLAPDYGKRDFNVAVVYVDLSGVSLHTVPKSTSRGDSAITLMQQMQAAVDYMQEQERRYQLHVTDKINAEIEAAVQRQQSRKGRPR